MAVIFYPGSALHERQGCWRRKYQYLAIDAYMDMLAGSRICRWVFRQLRLDDFLNWKANWKDIEDSDGMGRMFPARPSNVAAWSISHFHAILCSAHHHTACAPNTINNTGWSRTNALLGRTNNSEFILWGIFSGSTSLGYQAYRVLCFFSLFNCETFSKQISKWARLQFW